MAGWVAAEMAGVRVVEEMAAAAAAAKEVAVTAAAAMEAAVKEAADRAVAEKGVESLEGAFSSDAEKGGGATAMEMAVGDAAGTEAGQ